MRRQIADADTDASGDVKGIAATERATSESDENLDDASLGSKYGGGR